MVITRLFIYEIDGFCKMKAISDNDPGMIILDLNNNGFVTCKRINLPVVHNNSYIQDTEQYLFLSADDDIILRRYG